MNIVVTGGAGFIGSCLLWKLNQEGLTNIIVVDELGTSDKWQNIRGKQFADYLDKAEFLRCIKAGSLDKKIESIIHLGACSSTTEADAAYLMENNYGYSKTLAEWALRRHKRFIYASSAATYGAGEQGYSDRDAVTRTLKPLNMYGYSKQAFDLWVLKNNLQKKFVGLKFFNIYGPNEYHKDDMRSVVHKGYQQIKRKGKIRLFKSYRKDYKDGEQKRDFMYVKDAVDVVWHFMRERSQSGIVNVGTGAAHSWNQLAQALFSALKMKPHIEYFDMPAELRDKYQYFTEADTTTLRERGFTRSFTDFAEAIREYVTILETTQYL